MLVKPMELAGLVLDGLVADFRTHAGKHLLVGLGVHMSPMSFVASLLAWKLVDLAQSVKDVKSGVQMKLTLRVLAAAP